MRLKDDVASRREVFRVGGKMMLFGDVLLADTRTRDTNTSVIVQAGRRVDAADATSLRFPSANVDLVRERIRKSFAENKPVALVTAAACGTDLLALAVAGQMHIQRVILLPSSPGEFRRSSVADRPGDWGALFDQVMKEVHAEILTLSEGQAAYLETNFRLLDRAQALAKSHNAEAKAMVVWDLKSRGSDDVTGHFLAQAQLRHIPVIEISTL